MQKEKDAALAREKEAKQQKEKQAAKEAEEASHIPITRPVDPEDDGFQY